MIEELRRLGNTRYHGRPVSLYGGMVELPLIVTRDDGARWFADRDLLTSGRLWAERDADLRGDTQRLARELPDNLFGRAVWNAFEPATRTFLDRALGAAFSHADAGWLRGTAPRELKGLLELRNPAAHSEAVSRERVEQVRAQVMGIGCEGILVRLARAKTR